MSSVADEVLSIFAKRGESAYYGEKVSQLEHALQAALCAQTQAASHSLIVAALVHDIGHLLDENPEDIADHGVDARHEEVGRRWLESRFGAEVSEPVALHVPAKRYLCATDPHYVGRLSEASLQSLALQGGPMTPEEVREFESNPFHHQAVLLRTWDDQAKIPGMPTPSLPEYKLLIEEVSNGCG